MKERRSKKLAVEEGQDSFEEVGRWRRGERNGEMGKFTREARKRGCDVIDAGIAAQRDGESGLIGGEHLLNSQGGGGGWRGDSVII